MPDTDPLTIVVTGATGALGSALTARAAGEGHVVFATSRHGDASADGDVIPLALDVASPTSIAAAVDAIAERTESVDLLLGCAGVNRASVLAASDAGVAETDGPLDPMDADLVAHMVKVNALGPLEVVRHLVPLLRRSARATVVNVSSDRGSLALKETGGNYGYTTSKAALNMLTRGMAHDLAPHGVTVVAVHPGWFRSPVGGPNAPEDASRAATRVWDLARGLTIDDTGRFLAADGSHLPW